MYHQKIWSSWKHWRGQLNDSWSKRRGTRSKNESERRHMFTIGRHPWTKQVKGESEKRQLKVGVSDDRLGKKWEKSPRQRNRVRWVLIQLNFAWCSARTTLNWVMLRRDKWIRSELKRFRCTYYARKFLTSGFFESRNLKILTILNMVVGKLFCIKRTKTVRTAALLLVRK
jgi:hypothetical protein